MRKYKHPLGGNTLHMAADGTGAFSLEDGVPLGEGDEVDVGVSRITEELNNLRVAVQGIIRSWVDYSGIELGHDRWGKRHGKVAKLNSADMDHISDNTFTAIKTLALKAMETCQQYKPDDAVDIEGIDMLTQLCNVLMRVNMQKDCALGLCSVFAGFIATVWFATCACARSTVLMVCSSGDKLCLKQLG